MKETHSCEKMALAGAWIEYSDDACIFNISQDATEEDLMNNHHLEEIGETIMTVALDIFFCPYCGTQLREQAKKVTPGVKVTDFTDW